MVLYFYKPCYLDIRLGIERTSALVHCVSKWIRPHSDELPLKAAISEDIMFLIAVLFTLIFSVLVTPVVAQENLNLSVLEACSLEKGELVVVGYPIRVPTDKDDLWIDVWVNDTRVEVTRVSNMLPHFCSIDLNGVYEYRLVVQDGHAVFSSDNPHGYIVYHPYESAIVRLDQ